MIRVTVFNIFQSEKSGEFIVMLKGEDDDRSLPISIGQLEAQSIAMMLYKTAFPRPLTHDLFKTALDRLGSKVEKVVICDLVDNTFHARLFLESGGRSVEIDARPSDAIALALRFASPVFVEEKVMKESGVIVHPRGQDEVAAGIMPVVGGRRPERTAAKDKKPLDALKEKLAQAVRGERYEEAARLRDQISRLTESN
jgi:bifunctional DNase/RNase